MFGERVDRTIGYGTKFAVALGNKALRPLGQERSLNNIHNHAQDHEIGKLMAEHTVYQTATTANISNPQIAAQMAADPELQAIIAFSVTEAPQSHHEASQIELDAPPDEMATQKLMNLLSAAEFLTDQAQPRTPKI